MQIHSTWAQKEIIKKLEDCCNMCSVIRPVSERSLTNGFKCITLWLCAVPSCLSSRCRRISWRLAAFKHIWAFCLSASNLGLFSVLMKTAMHCGPRLPRLINSTCLGVQNFSSLRISLKKLPDTDGSTGGWTFQKCSVMAWGFVCCFVLRSLCSCVLLFHTSCLVLFLSHWLFALPWLVPPGLYLSVYVPLSLAVPRCPRSSHFLMFLMSCFERLCCPLIELAHSLLHLLDWYSCF